MHPARVLGWAGLIAILLAAPGARATTRGGAVRAARPAVPVVRAPRPADEDLSQSRRLKKPAAPAMAKRVDIVDNSNFIDINNAKMFVTNTGSFAWDKFSGNAGLEFPKGTGKTCVFAAGLWMGAQVNGETRICVSEYSDEYGPGPMYGANPANADSAVYKVYKLYRTYSSDTTGRRLRDQALADYNYGAVPHGAPAVDTLADGTLSIAGDEMLWAVYNDADPANHKNAAGSTNPLGLEVQQTTFAFNRQGALGNTIFLRYKIINKGGNTLDNMYVSQWSDPDDGFAGDDLVGCDTTLSVGFVYNGTNNDNVYGPQVPSVGYDFFEGPKVNGVPLPMTSFNGYTNGTDPDNFSKTYYLMQGLKSDGSARINPITNQPTTFMFSGDPVLSKGWLDTNTPQDVRLQCSSGPFTMAPGDTQVVTTAIIVGQSKNRLSSISQMRFFDSKAQLAFDDNFNLPPPPNHPHVTSTPLNGGVRLTWDNKSETYNVPPYDWEGYVVYQGASIAGPWTRIATFDLVNNITIVTDSTFNEDQGLVLPIGTAFGTNSGTQYHIDLTSDAVVGGPLHVGTAYYYSVNAYSVDINAIQPKDHVLESAFNPITVVPQTPPGGVDLPSGQVSAVTQGQYVPAGLPATDIVKANLIDPIQLKTASYKIGFKADCDTCLATSWYVVRTSDVPPDTIVNNWTNFDATLNEQNLVFDGVQVTVASYRPAGSLVFLPSAPALSGVARGLPFFNGGAGYAADDLGGTIPTGSAAPSCEIRFTGGPPGQKAYRYLRTLDNASNRVYEIQDYVDVPFTVWDTGLNRQLTACFLENAGPPPAANLDGKWDPDASDDGGREFVWVDTTGYSATPDPARMPGGDPNLTDLLLGNLPLLWEFASRIPDPTVKIKAGDKVDYIFSVPSTPNNYFTFTTKAVNQFNADVAKDQLNQVLAVPNPYFNHSSYELNQFARVVKFTHLPAVCTLRIFNLAGDLVRTIQKNDNTSQISWDLLTDRGLPVASGIYIFHVDAPSVGTKVGKVAIFMEKERLNTY